MLHAGTAPPPRSRHAGLPSARGRASYKGFTLIEVMVVVVIIAILVTMVGLSMKGDRAGEAVEEEGQRLTALLNLLREEAVMRDRDLGLVIGMDGYLFVARREPDQAVPSDPLPSSTGRTATTERPDPATPAFAPLADDSLFRPRPLPPGVSLRFENAPGRTMTPPGNASPYTPVVLALSADLLMPEGRLILAHPATPRVARILLTVDGARMEDHP